MPAPKGNQYAKGSTTNGRPSKYSPAYCNEVKEHMAQGFSLTTWGGTVGVCRETCHNWANEHEDFFNAIKIGRAKGQLVWEQKLMKQADEGGGNTAATVFAMKNLYRDDWADKIIQEHSGPDGGPIETAGSETTAHDMALKLFALVNSGQKEKAREQSE